VIAEAARSFLRRDRRPAVHLRQVAPFPRAMSEILDRYRTALTVENNRTGSWRA